MTCSRGADATHTGERPPPSSRPPSSRPPLARPPRARRSSPTALMALSGAGLPRRPASDRVVPEPSEPPQGTTSADDFSAVRFDERFVGPAVRKDVDMFAVQIALAVAERRGVPRDRLLRGSPIADRIGVRNAPVSWDAYVQIVDRLMAAVGGAEALAEVGGDLTTVTPQVSAFAALFVSPRRLARFFARVLDPRIWPCIRITYEELGGNVIRAVHKVPAHYREGVSVFTAGIGAWRTTPCRLGLPPAEMLDVDIGPRQGIYVMRLPESATVPARARRRALEAFARFAVEELETEVATIEHAFTADVVGEREAHARVATKWGVTPREREILSLLVHGYGNKDIANHLGCAVKTVEMHVGNLMRKSGVRARAELVSAFWRTH